MYMIDQVRPTLTAMSARTHWFYLLTKFCFQILENLFPCAVITPLDCFWEGSKLLGPDVYVPWVHIMSLPLIMWIGQNADAWISDVVCYTASVKKVKKVPAPLVPPISGFSWIIAHPGLLFGWFCHIVGGPCTTTLHQPVFKDQTEIGRRNKSIFDFIVVLEKQKGRHVPHLQH